MRKSRDLVHIVLQLAMLVGAALLPLVTFAAAYRLNRPFLMLAACLLPLAGIVAWYQPFFISSLFITFSYFRLQEAYPFLEPLKLTLLLGAASIVLVAVKVLLSGDGTVRDSRFLRTMCLLSLVGVVGVAYPHAVVRGGQASVIDVIAIPTVMIGASFCAVVWTRLLSITAETPAPINIQLFTAYFCWLSLTTIVSFVPSDSYSLWMNNPWKIAAMTLALSWLARSTWDFFVASTVFIVGGALVAAVVIYNKINSISLVSGTRVSIGRIEATEGEEVFEQSKLILSDPNDLALILLFPLAFALARLIYRRSPMDAFFALAMSVVIFPAIIFTQSRGALLGVIAIIGVLFFQRFKMALPALLAIVIAAPVVFSAMNLRERDNSGVTEAFDGKLEDSASHRLEAWETAINMAIARPLTGIGIGNFNSYYRRYTPIWRNREMSTHSMWFQVLAELGVVGLVLFVAMIATSFVVNAQSIARLEASHAPATLRAAGIALHGALAGTCMSGTFLSQAHTWPVYVIVGLVGALYNLSSARSITEH